MRPHLRLVASCRYLTTRQSCTMLAGVTAIGVNLSWKMAILSTNGTIVSIKITIIINRNVKVALVIKAGKN